MATIVNNPASTGSDDANAWVNLLIGMVVVILLATLFFAFALPIIRNAGNTPSGTTTQINFPAGTTSTSTGSVGTTPTSESTGTAEKITFRN